MTLRKDILRISSDEFVKHVVKMIHLHGMHLMIKSVLDWDLVAEFMTKCRRLKRLTLNLGPLSMRGQSHLRNSGN